MTGPKTTAPDQDPANWAQLSPVSRLNEAISSLDLNGIAWALERKANSADDQGGTTLVAVLLQAAATYRLVVAQEQTAYLLQRLVDATERDQ